MTEDKSEEKTKEELKLKIVNQKTELRNLNVATARYKRLNNRKRLRLKLLSEELNAKEGIIKGLTQEIEDMEDELQDKLKSELGVMEKELESEAG